VNTARVRQIFADQVFKAMDGIAILMEAKAIQEAPKGMGSLQGTIHSKTVVEGSQVTAQLACNSPYGTYLEHGTGPAVGHQKYFPPKGVLVLWMMRTLGMSREEAEDKEFVFRRALHEHGTKAQPFMEPARQMGLKALLPRLKTGISAAVRQVRSELG
jgi:hypothetical protein